MTQRLLLTILAIHALIFAAEAQRYTLSGHITDAGNGENLIGVGLVLKGSSTGVVTNSYGFYSITLRPGTYNFVISYIGYRTIDTIIDIQQNRRIDFELRASVKEIEEVVITARNSGDAVNTTQMSNVTLTGKKMNQIPVAFGEADLLKTLVLLPGVKSTDEGGSTLSVRGGGRDQNLIILDEATVYNASHLGNLLSVFNNDVVQHVEFFKGNFPAQYGGRLSSVIDIRMREGNTKRFSGSGGIGTLSSRLTLEGPFAKGRGSYLISGRRAYIDLLTSAIHAINDSFPKVPYYFYDLNIKANYNLNPKNRIYLSGYFGKDVFSLISDDQAFENRFAWGNYTGTLRWNSIPSDRLFTNLTLLISNYNYLFGNSLEFGEPEKIVSFDWNADLIDYSVKYDLGFYLNENNTLRAGFISTLHEFNPGKVDGRNDTLKYDFAIPSNHSLEHAIYLSDAFKVSTEFSIELGLRYSLFQNMGKTRVYLLDGEYVTYDTAFYGKGKIYNTYHAFEPRFSLNWKLNNNNSLKAGYSRTAQYVHVASNSNMGSLIDIWVGSGINIKPQYADLYSIGFFGNLFKNRLEMSIEAYYKDMQNQIEFREFATPQFNERMDEDFRFGKARSWGFEFFLQKSSGDFTGWLSYTWSKSEKKTNDIQEKNWYLSSFDRRHDLSIVTAYNLSPRFSFSANYQLKSGRPFTSPVKRYVYGGAVIPYYSGRNNDRMPIYHRLDFSVTLKSKIKPGRRFHSETTLSIFDVYNRNNAIAIYFRPDEDEPEITRAYRQNFLGFLPAITWNFSF